MLIGSLMLFAIVLIKNRYDMSGRWTTCYYCRCTWWLYHDSEYVTWCEPHFMYRLAQKHHRPLLSQYSCPYILLPVTSPSVDRFSQLFHWRQIYKRGAPDRNKCGTVDLLLLFSYTFFRLAAPSVKQVRFKPGVKERGSYGWAEWWIKKRRYDGWKNRWVGNGGTATRMRLMTR